MFRNMSQGQKQLKINNFSSHNLFSRVICQSLQLCLSLLTVYYNTLECFPVFAKLHFFIYFYGFDKITTNRTTEECQLLLKSYYSEGYNYQIHHCIFRLAAININNVVNYCSNIHDIYLPATNLC